MNKYIAYGAPCFIAEDIESKVIDYFEHYGKQPKKLFIDKDSWVALTFQLRRNYAYLFEDVVSTTFPPTYCSKYMGMVVYLTSSPDNRVCIEVA